MADQDELDALADEAPPEPALPPLSEPDRADPEPDPDPDPDADSEPVEPPTGPPPSVENQRPVILGRRRSVVATALWFTLGAGIAYLLFLGLQKLTTVLVILALSLLIALTLDPLVLLMQRRMPRWAAALIAWALTVAILLAPLVLTVEAATDQLPKLINSVPTLIKNAESHLGSLGTKLHSVTSGSSTSAL